MCLAEKRCNAWICLKPVGIQAEGCLRDTSWINFIVLRSSQSIFNQNLYIDRSDCKLILKRNVSKGSFGFIDLALFDNGTKKIDVFCKRPIISGKSLLYEACIQKLVGDSLAQVGFPTGAPHIVSIFKLHDESVCFAMEQIEGAITLDKFLDNISCSIQLAAVIIDCLIQLCAMIWHLDNTLGINHRDLKPSNFLIKEYSKPLSKTLFIACDILEIETKYSLTFIDFGFSCLGSTETNKSDISLSTVYSKDDPCPKEGRDLYLFLAFLYIDYHSKLPKELLVLFENWLKLDNFDISSFIGKDKNSVKQWIYWITGNQKVKKLKTCTYRVVKDLLSLNGR